MPVKPDAPPVIFPCGGLNQMPCPPQPAVVHSSALGFYARDEMLAYGAQCFAAGIVKGANASLPDDESETPRIIRSNPSDAPPPGETL